MGILDTIRPLLPSYDPDPVYVVTSEHIARVDHWTRRSRWSARLAARLEAHGG